MDFIHRFIPAREPGHPTLLLLHGTGGSEDDLLGLGQTLAPGWALLSPRGQVSEHGHARFFRRLREGVFDEPDLIARTHDLSRFVDDAASAYHFDRMNVIALGYSNGANIAASLLLLRPATLRGAILLRAMLPLTPISSPDLHGVRVLLASGRDDPMAPTASSNRLAEILRDAKATVTHHQSRTGHALEESDFTAMRAWLAVEGAERGNAPSS